MALDLKDPRVQDFLRQEKEKNPAPDETQTKRAPQKSGKKDKPKVTGEEKQQRRLFKKKRAGVVLSRDEVKAIKKGRKKLRKEMRARGIKGKRDFELTAGTLGLYFDKRTTLLPWLLSHWLGGLLGALAALLAVLFLFAMVTRVRGIFTINLSNGMFKEGFTLCETVGFENPSVQLAAIPAVDVPCVSINQIPTDVNEIDGEHNDAYFAYTFYLRNEGENTVNYDWELLFNSESQELSDGLWVMLFEDGKMRFYAKKNGVTGREEAIPAYSDNEHGYLTLPIRELAPNSSQFEVVEQIDSVTFYRVIPDKFLTDELITVGSQTDVKPMAVHKYTVVLWIEGDDPDSTDELIGGHAGVEMRFKLVSETDGEDTGARGFSARWEKFWEGLQFWQD